MFTINRVFIDSSVLVEYNKKSETLFLDILSQDTKVSLYISSIVISEYIFHALALKGNKAPLTLKRDKSISTVLTSINTELLLSQFKLIDMKEEFMSYYFKMMTDYNLLPNDALILATCKSYNINAIASYDSDFETPCKNENIILLKSVNDLKLLE